MTDIAKKRVQFGENTLFCWSEDQPTNDARKAYNKKPGHTVSVSDRKRRVYDGQTGRRGNEGTSTSNVMPVSAGKVERPLSAQSIKNRVTNFSPKRPTSARPNVHHLPDEQQKASRNSLPEYARQASRPLSERPVRSATDISRATSARSTSRPRSERPASLAVPNRDHTAGPINRALPERPIYPALPERPISRALPERPINGALPERPVSRALPERPINQTLTNGQVRGCDLATPDENGHLYAQSPAAAHSRSPDHTDMSSRLSPSKMAPGDNRQPRAGLTAWRLAVHRRKLQMLEVQVCDHGFFHEGDCYLILRVEPGNEARRTLHCWIGQSASQRDSERIRKRAVEMEEAVGKMLLFTIETQGHESSCFLRLFPYGICYVEDKGTPLISTASTYCKRLYHITGRKYPRAQCLKPNAQDTLDSSSVYLLDGSPRMYLWIGSKADYATKVKALSLSRMIRDVQRKGRSRLVIVAENDAKSHSLLLKKITGTKGVCHVTSPEVHGEDVKQFQSPSLEVPSVYSHILYWLSWGYDLNGMSEVARKPLRGELLTSESTYLLDTGPDSPIMIWVGHQAIRENPQKLLSMAKAFSTKRGYSPSLPVVIVSQGEEPSFFKRVFLTWRTTGAPGVRTYTAGSLGKMLFSRKDSQSAPSKKRVAWGPDDGLSVQGGEGVLEIWRLEEDDATTLVPRDQHGVFFAGNCYVLVYRPVGEYKPPVIYFWLGKESSHGERERALKVALDMDRVQENSAVLVRVLDGREPSDFLGLIHRKMMMYSGRHANSGQDEILLQMFSVEEMLDNNIRISQVPVAASSLCSRKAFVAMRKTTCHIWYGKNSGGHERGQAKILPEFLWPKRKHNFHVELEGKESMAFWQVVGGWDRYTKSETTTDLHRREPVLFHYCPVHGGYQQIPDFTQEDLAHDGVFVLDSFDQVMVWIGEEVSDDMKQNMAEIATAYMAMDPAGRHDDKVQLWFVKQHHEPDVFTDLFLSWDGRLQMGAEKVELLQASIRQENGTQDFHKEASSAGLSQLRRQSYKILMDSGAHEGLDNAHKERHLSTEEFQRRLHVSREEFYRFPEWKQNQIRRAARLSAA